ncbi:MAG: Hsp70 family protein [Phycisphaerales bacterium]|nr:Hsp70 family protein [Phycisphaerales bacterium]
MSTGRLIGIDLGTTFSSVAYVDATGHVVCLPNREGQTLTPSAVWLNDAGLLEVGAAAKAALTTHPDRVAVAFKRRMGKLDEPFKLSDRLCDAAELSAAVLRRLVEDAEHAIGPIAGAVITVPAYFGDRERSATLRAAEQAGIRVLDILNEPTAAALAYAFDAYLQAGGDPGDVATASIAATAPAISVVCDLGGGTFDVTVIRINGSRFDVLATGGSLTLGGRDWDERIADAMERHILDHAGPDPHYDPRAKARMLLDAEAAKHVLSVKPEASAPAPYDGVPALTLTRDRFESITTVLAERMEEIIAGVMNDAKLTWAQIEEVLLVGGSTRMPHVRQRIERLSGLTPNTRLQPDLAVAQGAAVYAAILHVQAQARSPVAAGANGGSGAPMKQSGSKKSTATHKRTAAGARAAADKPTGAGAETPDAAQSSLAEMADVPFPDGLFEEAFSEAAGSIKLTQVNARSLGVIVRSPRYAKFVNAIVIPRNSPLPAEESRRFVTHESGQRRIRIPIVEGETRDVQQSVGIGVCVIEPLPAHLPAGAEVEVTFTYDESGRVRVRAEELSTHTAAETLLHRPLSEPPPPSELNELAAAVAQLAGV